MIGEERPKPSLDGWSERQHIADVHVEWSGLRCVLVVDDMTLWFVEFSNQVGIDRFVGHGKDPLPETPRSIQVPIRKSRAGVGQFVEWFAFGR